MNRRRACLAVPEVRPLSALEVPLLAGLHAAVFPGEGWPAESFTVLLAGPGCCGWLSLERPGDGEPVPGGFLLARRAADEAEILTLGVMPERRGRGHARCLIESAFDWARAEGVRAFFLEVAEGNLPARRLYGRSGFGQVGERPRYYSGGAYRGERALILRADFSVSSNEVRRVERSAEPK